MGCGTGLLGELARGVSLLCILAGGYGGLVYRLVEHESGHEPVGWAAGDMSW